MKPLPFSRPLVLVTDRRRFEPPRPGEIFSASEWSVLEACVDAGIGAIQVREKDLDGRLVYERVRRLVARCASTDVRVLVNDRADIARAAHAAGVHLPGVGLPVAAARSVVGAGASIGCSIHASHELAGTAGADYVIFGPIFDTPSKRRYGAPQGAGRLRAVAEASTVPVLAIGGITVERVPEVLACGARGVAVMGALLSADDPSAAVQAFLGALAEG